MKRFQHVWMFIVSCACAGCHKQLDQDWYEMEQRGGEASKAFAAVVIRNSDAADVMADKKHELQAQHIERDWQDFLQKHTNSDGRMVSRDADGKEVPIRREDVEAAIAIRAEKLAELDNSRASWKAVSGPMRVAVGKFIALQEELAKGRTNINSAKKSAQEFVDSVLSAIGGLAAGAGLVAAAP